MSTPLDFSLRDDDELPAERYDLRAYGGYSLLPQEFDPRGQRLEAAFSAGAPDFWPQMINSAYRTENTLSSYLQSPEMSEKLLADVDPDLIKQLEDRDTTIPGQVQSKVFGEAWD